MARRWFLMGELLLETLRLVESGPLSGQDILIRLERRFARDYQFTPGRVFIGLEALEAEGLVESETGGSSVYRITDEGRLALSRRAGSVVPQRAGWGGRSDAAEEDGAAAQVEEAAFLFTDIVGSTQLLDRLGDQAAHRVRQRHFALLRRAVQEHGGREVKSLGDGLMVVFGDIQAAVACAISMQLAITGCEDALELRVGVASGEAVYEDDDYFGRSVIIARRLCEAARGGDVVMPEQIGELLPTSTVATLTPLGPLVLKGLSKPVRANRIHRRTLETST
jgi:class 3 adenylate cyclase